MNRITSYRIVDHGIEHAQYFQGHGTAFSEYDHTALGCGDNFAEAIEDAMENMAQFEECSGVDFEALELDMHSEYPEYLTTDSQDRIVWRTKPSASDVVRDAAVSIGEDPDEAMEDSEVTYYVSIDFCVESVPEVA